MNALTIALYALAALGIVPLAFALLIAWIIGRYFAVIRRIFEEQPLFIAPTGQPIAGSQEVRFRTADGLNLAGSYLPTTAEQRLGVILFGSEFGSNRWACAPYCEALRAGGYDIFTFDFRNQGDSDSLPGYEPLQWVTDHEVRDMEAAVAYLKDRPDALAGIGFFGVSRGGCTGLIVAAREPFVRCVVTDGAFATRSTMIPYMQKWATLYCSRFHFEKWLPDWAFGLIANFMLRSIGKHRNCRYPSVASSMAKIAPRPLFMIHGGGDTYIRPATAQELFARAQAPKEFWLVEGAKHNQAVAVANGLYSERLLDFFDRHLSRTGSLWNRPGRPRVAEAEPVAV